MTSPAPLSPQAAALKQVKPFYDAALEDLEHCLDRICRTDLDPIWVQKPQVQQFSTALTGFRSSLRVLAQQCKHDYEQGLKGLSKPPAG